MKSFEYKGVRIVYKREVEDSEFFITGFRGYGAVGYIATAHIVDAAKCYRAGFVLTRYNPEAVTPSKSGGVIGPFTLFLCEDSGKKFTVLLNTEIPLPQERSRFAEALIVFLKDRITSATLVGGFDSRFKVGEETYRWVATSAYRLKLNAPRMEEGLYVIGPLALLLLFAEVYEYPAVAILPYTDAARPDPRAAAEAVKVINELHGISINVASLLDQAKRIEELIVKLEQQKGAIPSATERAYM